MSKFIKFCKISWVIYALFTVAELILSIIITFTDNEANIAVHTGGARYFIPSFFIRIVTVIFYYLFTVFVEKWCEKNDVE
jgi:uncharacterized membrane protein